MTRRYFDTEAANQNHSPTKNHIRQSDVETYEIYFLFSPGVKLLLCSTWPGLTTSTPDAAVARGLTELSQLMLRKSVYDASSSPGFSCDITRVCAYYT